MQMKNSDFLFMIITALNSDHDIFYGHYIYRVVALRDLWLTVVNAVTFLVVKASRLKLCDISRLLKK